MLDKATKRVGGEKRSSAEVAFIARGRLTQLGGRNILFSPSRQEIFDLNETAAEIWRALKEGQSPAAIARGMGGSGLPGCEVGAFVAAALNQWTALDLIHPVLSSMPKSASPRSQVVSIAGMQIGISYGTEAACPVASVFDHLEVSGAPADPLWEVAGSGGHLHLYRNREWVGSCQPEELPTVLKGHLLTEVLGSQGYELALHAAALEIDGRAVLLSGRPGAGKTTLTLALANSGLIYGGDDVTLLNEFGRCISLPFAPAVKAGSWPILASWLNGLRTAPVFRRPDGKRVRYPTPEPFRRLVDCEIGYVIFLDRRGAGRAELSRVDSAKALDGLLAGAFAGGGDLTESAFEALVRAIRSAELYRLSYSDLADAVQVVRKACR